MYTRLVQWSVMIQRKPNTRGAGDQLRAQLIDAASRLLLEPQAISLPSLRAVARSCNVSPAAVYLHFDSQQALIRAVIDSYIAELGEHIEQAVPQQGDAAERVTAFAFAYARWGLSRPGAYQLLFESADRLDLPSTADQHQWHLLDRAGALVVEAAGAAAGAAPAAGLRLWSGMHGIVSLRIHKTTIDWPPLDAEVRNVLRGCGVGLV